MLNRKIDIKWIEIYKSIISNSIVLHNDQTIISNGDTAVKSIYIWSVLKYICYEFKYSNN